ncbi:lantibiotic dehydratase C-terminal domain-containing protein [Bailinhaonella thermotolerans]|uniref:Thiopeptide-type bacteriocin biosynthesis domain-containing protein n=1 Tax=Bailinhaonella thermotolerans TaxID=1070861 RepID=A0A3A4AXK8_9ACTN|nr:lantibiotic dehydratase C-terminal domain-containing protein [Bailinhaonella thermotolerans]RJL24152.1 hypothetical protein D5H75_30350 [Bailinhaonella thermotolerans]
MADEGGAWISACVYHSGGLDGLIRDVVAPLAVEAALDRCFFVRAWEGGQHLRIGLRSRTDGARLRRLVEKRAVAYFEDHPAPGNRLRFVNHRAELYGDAACLQAVERHFTESSTIALDVLAHSLGPGRRAAAGLAALTLTLAALEYDPGRAPGGLRLPPPRPGEPARWLRELWKVPDGGVLEGWYTSVLGLRQRLEELNPAPAVPESPLSFLAQALSPAGHAVSLILLRCAHLLNNRLGVPVAAEPRLAAFAVRALREVRGVAR